MAWKAMLLGVALVGLSWITASHAGEASTGGTGMDRAVLSAVVSLQCQGKDRGKVLLSARPTGPSDTKTWIPRDISSDEARELVKRTEATAELPKGIECPRVRMVSYVRLKAAFDKPAKHPTELPVPAGVRIPIGANTGFEDTFPDIGILLRLSMPIYSQTTGRAVVYFEEDCGGLCAHGEYVVVEQIKGVWRVTKRLEAWTS